MQLLRSEYDPTDPDLLDAMPLQFQVNRTADFTSKPIEEGLTLYLFRLVPNAQQRTPPSRFVESGRRRRPQLSLDAHFLLTAWGKSSASQHAILGWAMRVIEDHAILPAGLLDSVRPDVFPPDETVDVVPGALSVDEMMRVWDRLPIDYQLSVPYVARMIRIETFMPPVDHSTVDERRLETLKL